MNLMTVDPATLQAGPELDALICSWCEPKPRGRPNGGLYVPVVSRNGWWVFNGIEWIPNKHPSTDPAHAGEARRKETYHEISHGRWEVCVEIGGKTQTRGYAEVAYIETDDDKGKAEALATCRAIVTALKAAQAAKENRNG